MRYYRCKCGHSSAYGSMPPNPCSKCEKCGSDLAESHDLHREPKPHRFETEQVETDNGLQPLTRCVWCGKRFTQADITVVKPLDLEAAKEAVKDVVASELEAEQGFKP